MSAEQIPGYLAGANSDPLMVVMAVILIVLVLLAGVFYFKLHAIPEHLAHGKNHTQIQLITILTILALFTHNNIFWVAALVLAVVELPDFLAPLKSIAKSLETIAGNKQEKVQENTVVQEDIVKENNEC
jgi:flagellar basal body-associated protein FliL